ncbi:MAG: class I SAM-dependent methyltransferase [Corynebacterium sp.]|nr:class I SAM-dependent methyltransferase [Corynebacterium sp.]
MAHEAHLLKIDARTWPGLVELPTGRLLGLRAQKAEAEFARACDNGDIALDDDADLVVVHDGLFRRIAKSGWVGLGESYMAGEWYTRDYDALVHVLSRLLSTGYNPKTPEVKPTADEGGELPAELTALYSGDGFSHHGGLYVSGVPTTVRQSLPVFARGSRNKTHFVDVTTFSAPDIVDREDLGDAQRRFAQWLVESSDIHPGAHVMVYPACALQAGIAAADRRATVDLVSADAARVAHVNEQLLLEGAADAIATQLIDHPIPSLRDIQHRFDAIFAIEKFEHLLPAQRREFVRNMDSMLARGGHLTLLSTVATDSLTAAGKNAMQILRGYVWPAFDLPTIHDVHKIVEQNSQLRIISQTHCGSHTQASLAQQRSFFTGHLREAAAAGFDEVFRRLWIYQFALREALLALGLIDVVAFGAMHRTRGGRR